MIINEHQLNNKDGILITYENGKTVFFTNKETEKIKRFLVKRNIGLRANILNSLHSGRKTLGDLTKELGIDYEIIDQEVAALEFEGIVEINSTVKVEHPDLGTMFAPYVQLKKE